MSPKTAAARPAPLTSTDYLKQVLTARVYDVAVESDLDPARNLGRRLQVGTLIVNGGECEPYLSSDDRMMRDRAAEVVDGLRIVMHAIGAREALIGIEDNKPQAIAAMRVAAAAFGNVHLRVVPARYPMGSDKQLIQTLTGKEVPADARAAEVGVLVHNVSTCAAVHRAVRRGEPLVERIVTLNGGALTRPGNVLAPIGTPVVDLLRFAGVSGRTNQQLKAETFGAGAHHIQGLRADRTGTPQNTQRFHRELLYE